MRTWCVVRGAWGTTLLELLVVLTVFGVILGVSGLALATLNQPREAALMVELRRARAEAIHSGTPRTTHHVRFLPDGRAIGPGADALTGAPRAK
jgi:prepilin-type N-terminal cleavage/methylation domain-containing protein